LSAGLRLLLDTGRSVQTRGPSGGEQEALEAPSCCRTGARLPVGLRL